jgi:hypothetical protein
MSETPEFTPENVPAETQEARQPKLCFEAVETQKEIQIEMRFEAETPNETQNELCFETMETQVEKQAEKQSEKQAETLIETPSPTPTATPNEMRLETVEIPAETPVEPQVETRPERRTEPRLETWVDTRVQAPSETPQQTQTVTSNETSNPTQTETPSETRVEAKTETRIEIESEQQTEKRAATRPEPQAVTLNDRPFRVKLRGSILVLIRLPNKRQLRAALHQLSTSGGVMNLEKPLDEKIEVELIFHIDRSTIRGKAQMLFPMWATQGWMQPFRFVELTDTDRDALKDNLQSFIGNLAKGASTAG